MTAISVLNPLDQPLGHHRLLEDLRHGLREAAFDRLRICVAFASSGPLLRLAADIEAWKRAGKRIEAIFGVDLEGTSRQALEFALAWFDDVYYTQERGITFHPKIYLFDGPTRARCFIGSNNLTVSGTETNFEAGLGIDMELPADAVTLSDVSRAWDQLLPPGCLATTRVTSEILAQLVTDGVVVDEQGRGSGDWITSRDGARKRLLARKTGLPKKPPSALPRDVYGAKPRRQDRGLKPVSGPPISVTPKPRVVPRGFALQIKPHHNGEIFLSRTAADQNPEFFGLPFTGMTNPKLAKNAAYPQRAPDPVVNITVLNERNEASLILPAYALNMVLYTQKSEIRVTASPLIEEVPPYSIMIMEPSDEIGIDYEITILVPSNPDYPGWLAACNQTMPAGGSTPRKFGWF